MRNTTTTAQPSLVEALREAQRLHVAIIPTRRSVKLWAPGLKVPGPVRQAITTNKKEVLKMLDISEIAVCPSPQLHRHAYSYFHGHYICDLCSRIDRAMRQASERRTA